MWASEHNPTRTFVTRRGERVSYNMLGRLSMPCIMKTQIEKIQIYYDVSNDISNKGSLFFYMHATQQNENNTSTQNNQTGRTTPTQDRPRSKQSSQTLVSCQFKYEGHNLRSTQSFIISKETTSTQPPKHTRGDTNSHDDTNSVEHAAQRTKANKAKQPFKRTQWNE